MCTYTVNYYVLFSFDFNTTHFNINIKYPLTFRLARSKNHLVTDLMMCRE